MERKRRPLLAAFCIPTAIMLAVIVYKQIYPFGDRCFLRVDMYNQYMPFFTEFHRKLREGGSLRSRGMQDSALILRRCMPTIWQVPSTGFWCFVRRS